MHLLAAPLLAVAPGIAPAPGDSLLIDVAGHAAVLHAADARNSL